MRQTKCLSVFEWGYLKLFRAIRMTISSSENHMKDEKGRRPNPNRFGRDITFVPIAAHYIRHELGSMQESNPTTSIQSLNPNVDYHTRLTGANSPAAARSYRDWEWHILGDIYFFG